MRDQFEIGIEREYALYAWVGGTLSYLLANGRLLAAFHEHIAGDGERAQQWQRLTAAGWRIDREYSHCLVEIASPPVTRDGWSELLADFARLEEWLAQAAITLQHASNFDGVECTAAFSVRTDRFVAWTGAVVTTFSALLLNPADDNWLLGSSDNVPACLSAPELSYAGFTSTNATVHPPHGDIAECAAELADYYWLILHAARTIDVYTPQRHPLLRDGRIAVPPDPELTIRDALIRWGDPATASLLDTIDIDDGPARFHALFGQSPSASFSPAGFHAYSCRPRVVENTMLFELRCFHSGLPLANLAPLLDIAARLLTR
ncbi:hypothetical protein BH11MYX2_BH11MYX2_23530 [soil metagenome]